MVAMVGPFHRCVRGEGGGRSDEHSKSTSSKSCALSEDKASLSQLGAMSEGKIKNWFVRNVPISSYEYTRQVWRAREKGNSFSGSSK